MVRKLRQFLVKCGYSAVARGWRPPSLFANLITDFHDRSYLRRMLTLFDINFVVDVGACTGGFARNIRRMGYLGELVSFEPNPDSFDELANVMRNDARWRGLNIALGQQATTAPFLVTEMPNLSSFHLPHVAHVQVRKTISVDIHRLDSVLPELLQTVATPKIFLKIDTQGFDLEVVKGAREILPQVVLLQSEISVDPLYEEMPHYLEALALYESLGFKLMTLFPVARNPTYENVIEYDCLMARLDQNDRLSIPPRT